MEYITISGDKITGLVIYRYEKIMTVAGDDGRNYVCWLVGESDPVASFTPKNVMEKYEENRIACRAIFPNGEIVDFASIKAAANHFRMSASTVTPRLDNGNKITRGRLKGVRFEKIVEVPHGEK